jgi:two-component system, response regulator PdtaR
MEAESATRVLIVEDDAMVAMVIQFMLEDKGYEVVATAKDGLSAVGLTFELRPDVVLMDLNMPDMDGLEAARRILQCYPIPIIALTGYSKAVWGERASRAGIVDFLEKPTSAHELADAIHRARP